MDTPTPETLDAAEKGDALAQFEMGSYYLGCVNDAESFEQAIYWFNLAAMQGHGDAQNNLGQMLLMDGAHYDFAKAVELLEKAAAGGQADAIDTLAMIKSTDKRG